jgi:hypothetical protein
MLEIEEAIRANVVNWVESEANGEAILGVVIGARGEMSKIDDAYRRRLLSWAEARALLDYYFYDGFGGAECDAVYVWTASKIMGIAEYDGSTRLFWVPRHPVDCEPKHI